MALSNRHRSVASETSRESSRVRFFDPGNLILDSLPEQEAECLKPYLAAASLQAGQILHEAYRPISFAYFPTGGLVSLRMTMRNGAGAEVAMVGNEGFVGVPLLLHSAVGAFVAAVQISGSAYRIEASSLKRALSVCPRLHFFLQHWLQAQITEIAQRSACNSTHSVRQRLASWLLLSSARTGCDCLSITHDMLAQMLACRRSSITSAARHLHAAQVIDYKRGSLTILSESALERLACECYRAIQLAQPEHATKKLASS